MTVTQSIECSKTGMTHVVGKGGATIKRIKAESGAQQIDTKVHEDNPKKATVTITAEDDETLMKAVKEIKQILADQEEPDYEGPEGSRLRAKADAHGKERDRLKNEADKLFEAGDKGAGMDMMAKRKIEDELMRSTTQEAALAVLKNRNDGQPDSYLDLHGLRTNEAEEFTIARLDALEKKAEGTNFNLIPGAGHHSAPGKVALGPMCEALLTKRKIQWTEIAPGSMMAKVKGTKGEYAPDEPVAENQASA